MQTQRLQDVFTAMDHRNRLRVKSQINDDETLCQHSLNLNMEDIGYAQKP